MVESDDLEIRDDALGRLTAALLNELANEVNLLTTEQTDATVSNLNPSVSQQALRNIKKKKSQPLKKKTQPLKKKTQRFKKKKNVALFYLKKKKLAIAILRIRAVLSFNKYANLRNIFIRLMFTKQPAFLLPHALA